MEWLTGNKIPVGKWASGVFSFFKDNFSGFFDSVADAAKALIEALLREGRIIHLTLRRVRIYGDMAVGENKDDTALIALFEKG